MEDNEIDETLKRLLGHVRPIDADAVASRVMAKIREENNRVSAAGGRSRRFVFNKARWGLAVGNLAILAIACGLLAQRFHLLRRRPEQHVTETVRNYGPSVPRTTSINAVLLRTDFESTLMTNQAHVVANDPLLKPHSIWDQKPSSKL